MSVDNYTVEQAIQDAGIENVLQAVMGVAGINTFFYYPKKQITIRTQAEADAECIEMYSDNLDKYIALNVHPDYRNEFRRPYRELERGAKKAIAEYYNLDQSKYYRITLKPLCFDGEGKAELVLGIKENLTQDKRRYEKYKRELLEREEDVQNAKSSKNIFLNCISMNVRKPMKKIITMAKQAEDSLDIKQAVKENLQGIVQDGKRIMGHLNEVLDMNRLENGRIMLEEGPCSLYWVMKDVNKLLENSLQDKKISLRLKADEVQNDGVICDKLRIQQVLMNLSTFYIEHVSRGETISLSLVQRAGRLSKKGEFSFIMQGNMDVLSKEELQKLFDPYQGPETNAIGSIKGTSLGMPIAAKLVELMQGELYATSSAEEGTVMTIDISFPLASN